MIELVKLGFATSVCLNCWCVFHILLVHNQVNTPEIIVIIPPSNNSTVMASTIDYRKDIPRAKILLLREHK